MNLSSILLVFVAVNAVAVQTRNSENAGLKTRTLLEAGDPQPDDKNPPASNDNQKPNDKTDTPNKQGFENPLYIGNTEKQNLKTGQKLPVDILLLKEATDKDAFNIKDGQKKDLEQYFKITADKKSIHVEVKTDLKQENLKDINEIVLIIELLPDQSKNEKYSTVVLIYLNDKEPSIEKLTFKKSKYEITAFAEYTGIIEHFSFEEKIKDKYIIKYAIETNNDELKKSLEIDESSGILSIKKALKPSQYNVKISAKIDGTEVHGASDLIITVNHVTVCDSKEAKFPYSQLVKHVEENKKEEILPAMSTIDNCVYKIVYQSPQGDYFDLDEKTGALTLKKEVQRDPKVFKDMTHPKFTVELSLVCGTKVNEDQAKIDSEIKQSHYIDIPFNTQRMFLIVMIDEVKKPIFSSTTLTIGYPKQFDFILQNPPSYAASISAATNHRRNIQYSIVEENCPFSINPTSGNLYPVNYHSGSDDTTFTVVAKGENEEEKLKVTVKYLANNEIVETYFMEATADSFDSLLNEINSHLVINIKPLSYAVIPITEKAKKSNKALAEKKPNHLLKAYCYGLDKKQTITKGEEIAKKLSYISNIYFVQVVPDKKPPGKYDKDSTTSSFILTTGIIGILVTIGIIISVIYLIFLRRKNLPIFILNRNNDRTSTTPLEDDMEGPSHTRWISSQANMYNKYDHTRSSAFSNPMYQNRRVSYSNTNGEIVLMDHTRHVEEGNFVAAGVSSFKPEQNNMSTENFNKNIYTDLDFSSRVGQPQTSDIPVLPVSSLQSVTDRRRRKTNDDS